MPLFQIAGSKLIEALNFRCLRYVSQPLGPFHVLAGPNASGKRSGSGMNQFRLTRDPAVLWRFYGVKR